MKLDSIDLGIIKALLDDARMPFSQIATELGVPITTVHFRFKKMKENGLIKGFTVYLDPSPAREKMITLSIRIKAVSSKIDEVRDYVENLHHNQATKDILIPYTWSCVGYYNMGAYIVASSAIEMSTIIQILKRHPSIIDAKVGVVTNEHWYLKTTFIEQLSKMAKENG